MPALSNISINDGETTPVTHVFKPAGPDGQGVFVFRESDGVAVGDNVLTVSSRDTGNYRKVILRLRMPQTATQVVNGVSSEIVSRTNYAEATFRFAPDSTTQERLNLVTLMKAALQSGQNPDLQAVLVDNEGYY
jgi:hypothetical protein